jgi:predicted RNA-binding protein with PUA-like domain
MWLLKTEPSVYGYDDLERDGHAVWDGVKNPMALKNLRGMSAGDLAFLYHTGDVKAVVGVAEVTRAAYPDPKAKSKDTKLVVVDLKPLRRLPKDVPLGTLKAMSLFADSPLVRQGRLSVVPLTAAQWKAIERESGR